MSRDFYERVLASLEELVGEQPGMWEKTLELWRELCPE